MAISVSRVLKCFRILTLPIFPDPDLNASRQKMMFLLFVHILSGLIVFIAVYAPNVDRSDESKVGNWVVVIIFVILGVISLFYLIIRGFQNKLRDQGVIVTQMSDPSLNLRILFLWIFGLAVTIHVLINLAIDIQCMTLFPLPNIRVVFTLFSNAALLLFLLVQTGFVTYYRNSSFLQVAVVNIASILILSANFAVWFSTTVITINDNITIPYYNNESYCFRTSSIQRGLGRKLSPYLLPSRLEFCILASSFIISFWRWPIERDQNNTDNSVNRENDYHIPFTHRRYKVIGPHVFATMFGIILNIPVFMTQLLLTFVFDWEDEDVFFAMHVGQVISSLCSIIAIYICSYHLIRRFDNCWKPARLTVNEYILIISSCGMVGHYAFGFVASLSSSIPVYYMFLISRIIGLVETFLQTYFLLKLKRFLTGDKTSVLISSTGILMMIKNLIFWFLYSYNALGHTSNLDHALVDDKESPNPTFNAAGQKVAFLLFLHILSGSFVFLSLYGAGKDISDERNMETWGIVTVFVTVGLISLVILSVRGCQNKLIAHGRTTTRFQDLTLNLQILFLWIFGLAVVLHVLFNFAIYVQCLETFSVRKIPGIISELSSVTLLLFLLIQITFITYYRTETFVPDAVVNIASINILSANFAVWFNTVVSSTNGYDTYENITIYRNFNESYCFRTSNIQLYLGNKLRPFLLPPRLEFCILASSFMISFWRWPIGNEDIDININTVEDYQIASTERRHVIIGPHVFATVFGIILSIPVFFTRLLLVFVFDWAEQNVYFALHLGTVINSMCNIIAIYVSSYHLIKRFGNCWKQARLTTNEYILIISSSGIVAYFVFGLLTVLSSSFPVFMFLTSRITALLETFLQTHFLLKLKRYKTDGKTSILISSVGILLMMKNLIFGVMYSFNELVDIKDWVYLKKMLSPLVTFYRFFSGIISYSVYLKFRS